MSIHSRTKKKNVTLQDYLEDENEEEESISPEPSTTSTTRSPPTIPSTTTTTTTTSTTTSTTPRPMITSRYELKDQASVGSQYNGYREKNEYPAMSSHSALKWQQLGTRDAVKETRNNMLHFGKLSRCEYEYTDFFFINNEFTLTRCNNLSIIKQIFWVAFLNLLVYSVEIKTRNWLDKTQFKKKNNHNNTIATPCLF